MWLLRNEEKGLTFRVLPGKPNIVSRKDGDLLLLGDQSISRKHAEISVNNENKKDGIILKDLGSKYGTFTVQGGEELVQMPPNQTVNLNHGDCIRFGIQWNIWRVEYFPLVVATSTLNTGEKAEVREVVAALGGDLANDWQPCCTHLTMNNLTVTVKVVCALACGRPIVLPGYWKELKNALTSAEIKLPDCKDLVPPLAEALLNPLEVSFTPNPERRKLFSGYTFVASSNKQLARIKPMVSAAGGTAIEFSTSSWPENKLLDEKTILMQHTAGDKQGSQQSQVPDGYITAARKLKAAGVRCVPESEIGLSILYCNMSQYCNPRFSRQALLGASSSLNTQQITVICPDTEDTNKPQQKGVVAGTSGIKKRALEDSGEEDLHPTKKTNSNSEDMFSSQSLEVQIDENSNRPSTSSNKSTLKEKRPIVNPSLDMFAPSGQSDQNKNLLNIAASNSSKDIQKSTRKSVINPSLDMFAPSGQISGQSDQNKNILNITASNSSKDIQKPLRQSVVNPSLDMFAPSGQISSVENKNPMNPSCQDMFASNESRHTIEKKKNTHTESRLPQKQLRLAQVDEVDDAFSFTSSNKKVINFTKNVMEKNDEFAFPQKSNRQSVVDEDVRDVFSFVSNKEGNKKKAEDKLDDEFSFVSNRSSKKRNCQSDPDIFESSIVRAPPHIRTSTSNITSDENDDVFAFSGGPASKKMKENDQSKNLDEPDAEVKLGLFSKGRMSLERQNASEPTVIENPPDDKNLVTYRKTKPCLIGEETKDEEIDELVRELHNATMVVVTPLVVKRQKPAVVQCANSGKNFKKFRKVTGMSKRIVPHIIGGSDLVPHYANCRDIDDILPPSPPRPTTPADDWEFVAEKKKKGKPR